MPRLRARHLKATLTALGVDASPAAKALFDQMNRHSQVGFSSGNQLLHLPINGPDLHLCERAPVYVGEAG